MAASMCASRRSAVQDPAAGESRRPLGARVCKGQALDSNTCWPSGRPRTGLPWTRLLSYHPASGLATVVVASALLSCFISCHVCRVVTRVTHAFTRIRGRCAVSCRTRARCAGPAALAPRVCRARHADHCALETCLSSRLTLSSHVASVLSPDCPCRTTLLTRRSLDGAGPESRGMIYERNPRPDQTSPALPHAGADATHAILFNHDQDRPDRGAPTEV